MKKILLVLLATFCLTANAQYGHHRFHPHPHHVWKPGMGWVIPSIIGGVVVYEIVKAQQPQQVVVEKEVVVCSEWKEIETPEGKLYRERSCSKQNLK